MTGEQGRLFSLPYMVPPRMKRRESGDQGVFAFGGPQQWASVCIVLLYPSFLAADIDQRWGASKGHGVEAGKGKGKGVGYMWVSLSRPGLPALVVCFGRRGA